MILFYSQGTARFLSYTIRKLTNINGYIDKIFSSVDCGEFFRLNMPLQYPLINTDVVMCMKLYITIVIIIGI